MVRISKQPKFPFKAYDPSLYICIIRLLNDQGDHWALLRMPHRDSATLYHWAASHEDKPTLDHWAMLAPTPTAPSYRPGQQHYVARPVRNPRYLRSIPGLGDILAFVNVEDCKYITGDLLDKACCDVPIDELCNALQNGENSRTFTLLVLEQLIGR